MCFLASSWFFPFAKCPCSSLSCWKSPFLFSLCFFWMLIKEASLYPSISLSRVASLCLFSLSFLKSLSLLTTSTTNFSSAKNIDGPKKKISHGGKFGRELRQERAGSGSLGKSSLKNYAIIIKRLIKILSQNLNTLSGARYSMSWVAFYLISNLTRNSDFSAHI